MKLVPFCQQAPSILGNVHKHTGCCHSRCPSTPSRHRKKMNTCKLCYCCYLTKSGFAFTASAKPQPLRIRQPLPAVSNHMNSASTYFYKKNTQRRCHNLHKPSRVCHVCFLTHLGGHCEYFSNLETSCADSLTTRTRRCFLEACTDHVMTTTVNASRTSEPTAPVLEQLAPSAAS